MSPWLAVGALGGVVGLDTTSFPQAMISRPLVAAALTGAIFGRPLEGAALGFVLEAFALTTLPIGAARYPESGTAAIAGVSAYVGSVDTGPDPGLLLLAVAFALVWEWVAGETVVWLRRSNGRILARHGGVAPTQLERRHLAAMTMDFARGGVVAVGGGLLGYGILWAVGGSWAIPGSATIGVLTVLAAAMVGTTLSLFGGMRDRRLAWALGLVAGVLTAVVL